MDLGVFALYAVTVPKRSTNPALSVELAETTCLGCAC